MQSIITALIALSKHPVGVREAAILLLCKDGKTAPELADATGDTLLEIRGRVQALRRKKLLRSGAYGPSGHILNIPTPAGLRIIEASTNQ